MNVGKAGCAGAGNSTKAVFYSGDNGVYTNSATSKIYEYSSGSWIVGATYGGKRTNFGGTGTTEFAIFAGWGTFVTNVYYGNNDSAVYAYSSGVFFAGSNLSVSKMMTAAAGNAVCGIFSSGYSNTGYVTVNDKYRYADSVVAPTVSLSSPRYGLSAASSAPGWLQ